MSRRPNYPSDAITVRLPTSILDWLEGQAGAETVTRSEAIRRTLTAFATCFSMAQAHARVIEEDRQTLGLSWRDYLHHLLARRFELVSQHGPGFDPGPSATVARPPTLSAVPSVR